MVLKNKQTNKKTADMRETLKTKQTLPFVRDTYIYEGNFHV